MVLASSPMTSSKRRNMEPPTRTLEAVTSLELVLLDGDGGWNTVYVDKNRSGPKHRNIGRVKYTSVQIGELTAAIIDEMIADETQDGGEPKERGPSGNAKILRGSCRRQY